LIQPATIRRWKSRSIDEVVRHGSLGLSLAAISYARPPSSPACGRSPTRRRWKACSPCRRRRSLHQGRRSDLSAALSDARRLRQARLQLRTGAKQAGIFKATTMCPRHRSDAGRHRGGGD
jgi:hypothetical protein